MYASVNVIQSVLGRNRMPIATGSLEYSIYDIFGLVNSDYVDVIPLRCLGSRSRAKSGVSVTSTVDTANMVEE